MKRSYLFVYAALIIILSGPAMAADLRVSSDGSAQFGTIQSAIDASEKGDRVIVADGEYKGEGNKDLDFKGKAITVTSENGPAKCIIDCEKSSRAFLFYHNETETSVVSGFTIINANTADGGAIRCGKYNPGNIYEPPKATDEKGSPTISNCVFRDNVSDYQGGGIIVNTSNPVIRDCVFENNRAQHYGGAIAFMNDSDPKIINCSFTKNSAYSGGAIHAEESKGQLIGLYIYENFTTTDGTPPGFDGGGICLRKSETLIERCIVVRNKSYWGAGISVKRQSVGTIKSCLIAENEGGRGSGISVRNSESSINGCTIAKNSADGGNNDFDGIGGIYCEEIGASITNSIIWNNSNGQIGSDKTASLPSVTYCSIEGGFTGSGNIAADPLFTGNGDYHITPESPCIGSANATTSYIFDLDNKTRADDGIYTMGAYEEPRIGGKENPGKSGSSGGGCFIREAARGFDLKFFKKTW